MTLEMPLTLKLFIAPKDVLHLEIRGEQALIFYFKDWPAKLGVWLLHVWPSFECIRYLNVISEAFQLAFLDQGQTVLFVMFTFCMCT